MNGAPSRVPRFFCGMRRAAAAGWTLAELAMVIAIASILTYGVVQCSRPLDVQSLQQADRLRNDLRRMQMLALAWGRPLRLTVAAGSYSVSCVSAGAAPCDASPVVDPASGTPFAVALEPGLSLGGPGYTLDFDELGRPKNGASLISANAAFSITAAATPARQVLVTPVAGFASVQ